MKCLASNGQVYLLSDTRYKQYLKLKQNGDSVELASFGKCLGAPDDVTALSPQQAGERLGEIQKQKIKPPPLALMLKHSKPFFAAVAKIFAASFEIRPPSEEILRLIREDFRGCFFSSEQMIQKTFFVHMTVSGRSIVSWCWHSSCAQYYRIYHLCQNRPGGRFHCLSNHTRSSPEEVAQMLTIALSPRT